ncbi:sulfurtransferase TusA family protein [Haematospirillum jordaniae]|uniref:sulfurtransferase TusA family protein n=1 Tax=Haematospirillum jordaniae TaxID=1549855 RepID=UPI002AC32CA3|nr:sulfurtransferase TusA family protein [Haematospirillum jordaniae]
MKRAWRISTRHETDLYSYYPDAISASLCSDYAGSRVLGRVPCHELDCRGMSCPLPVLRTLRAVSDLQPGESLRVICDDHIDESDFRALCQKAGVTLVSSGKDRGQRIMLISRPDSDKSGITCCC